MKANVTLVALVILPFAFATSGASAQQEDLSPRSTAQASAFTAEQLEQMAAPIALYPDALMMQILMAATYPLEIIQADRWLTSNAALAGAALEEALKQHEWDPSVKSLCGFPSVLKQMSDNVDWTRDLGDAFLGQKDQILDTIQSMRRKALQAGNLKTTEQQSVMEDGDVVAIEPVNPQVIYVPTYSPMIVYGPGWSYPYWYYPYFYGPPGPGFGFVTFGIGFSWGFGLWGGCDWHHHSVNVNVGFFNEFNAHTNAHPGALTLPSSAGGRAGWVHNPEHRMGVGYKSGSVAQAFGARPGASRVTRDQARGFDRSSKLGTVSPSRVGPKGVPPVAAPGSRSPPSPSPSERGGQRPAPPAKSGNPAVPRPAVPPVDGGARRTPPAVPPASGGLQHPAPRPSAVPPSYAPRGGLSGFRNPSFDHSASSRGAASRGGASRGPKGRS